MFRRASLAVLATLVAGSGCTLSQSGRNGVLVGGAVITAASVLVIRSGANDTDHDGVNDYALNDDWGAYMAGTAMLLGGLGLFVAGLASSAEHEPDRTYATPVAATPTPVWQPPAAADPANEPAAAAQIAGAERVALVALPELPATAEVLRLAKQVRSASSHGRCDAAWIMWMDLQKLDATYARALRDGEVLARCAM